jgi:4-hydroxybenzoate polyprenyltransferase
VSIDLFQFARPGNWWCSKIPPLLAVAYLTVLVRDMEVNLAGSLIACFVFSVSCVATYGHIINDAFDIEQDRLAGRHNAMAGLSWSARVMFALVFLALGFLPAPIANYSLAALVLLAFNYLWPTIYSAPTIRLKERQLAGVISDAMGSHITPTLFAIAVFGAASGEQGRVAFPLLMTLWAAALGIKGILHHQVADRESDMRSGTMTFATTTPPERIRQFLVRFNLWVELPLSAALVLLTYGWCPLAAAAFATYCVVEAAKYRLGFKFSLNADARTVRPSVPFANEMFYTVWLPLAAAVQLAVRNPAWWWLPLLHAAAFYPMLFSQLTELKSVMQISTRPYRRRLFKPRK